MIFRQDFKKVYVRAGFVIGWFLPFLAWRLYFHQSFNADLVGILGFFILLPALWPISHLWYYFEIANSELRKHLLGSIKTIPIMDITELSYEDNPVRPLVYITYNTPNGNQDHIDFTTGVWSPHMLYALNAELQRMNPYIEIKFDEKTKKQFEKDKNYHLYHPKNFLGWFALGIRQVLLGILFGVVLVFVLRYL